MTLREDLSVLEEESLDHEYAVITIISRAVLLALDAARDGLKAELKICCRHCHDVMCHAHLQVCQDILALDNLRASLNDEKV